MKPVANPGNTIEKAVPSVSQKRYVTDIDDYLECRIIENQFNFEDTFPDNIIDGREALVNRVASMNHTRLWAPADGISTGATHPSVTYGDQARAVFGAIPTMSCLDPKARIIRTQVDGNQVRLLWDSETEQMQFAHYDKYGEFLYWTNQIDYCDKPSLAGGVTECGMGSRIVRKTKHNVEWALLCRKSMDANHTLRADDLYDYWSVDNPKFSLYGMIAFNRATGEVQFFDGFRDDSDSYDMRILYPKPGGEGYDDKDERIRQNASPKYKFNIRCHRCHDNKNPWIPSPHLTHTGFGFRSIVRDDAFSIGDLFGYNSPDTRSDPDQDTPYRIIGTSYVDAEPTDNEDESGLSKIHEAKSLLDPSGKCSACHTLTTLKTGRLLAFNALGKYNHVNTPWDTEDEWRNHQVFIRSRQSDWAKSSSAGNLVPWMQPDIGHELHREVKSALSEAEINALMNCLNDKGGAECHYQPLFTKCPVPDAISFDHESRLFDDSTLHNLMIVTNTISADKTEANAVIRWNYLNNLGDVPDRDDVRFDVSVKFNAILNDSSTIGTSYGTVDATQNAASVYWHNESNALRVDNVAPFNQEKHREPSPSLEPRKYRISIPVQCNNRMQVTIRAKRFCFDGSGIQYGQRSHQKFVDFPCPIGIN